MKAYCLACKAQREVKGVKKSTTATGTPMIRGTCQRCGTKVAKFVKLKSR